MEFLLPGFYTSIQFIVLMGLGFYIRKSALVGQGFQKSISSFLVKVALPLYFFTNMGSADMASLKNSLIMPFAAAVNVAVALALSIMVFSFISLPRMEKRAGIAFSSFGNSGYIPLSLVEILPVTMPFFSGMTGGGSVAVLIGVYVFIYSPVLWSLGNYLVASRSTGFSIRELFSPSLAGILAGLVIPLAGFQEVMLDRSMPFVYIFSSLERLGAVITPLILINLGAMIAEMEIHSSVRKKMNLILASVVAVRYLMMPAVFYIMYFLFLKDMDLDMSILFVLFLEFHTPPANNFSAMAMDAGINEDLVAYILLVTYILYVLILPFALLVFRAAAG